MIIPNMMRKFCLALACLSLFTSSLWAAPQPIPDDAQRELSSQTNSLIDQKKNLQEKPAKKPEIEIKKETPEKPDEEEGPVFFVKKINIEGNTIFKDKDFEFVAEAFENRKASFRHLRSLSEIITNTYRSQGYVTSRAYLPPQTVENDTVTIKVVEGKVGKIFVDGNRYFSAKTYEKYMKFDSNHIFRYQDLERDLYRLNRKPDREAKAFLIPGEELASSDIILKVKDSNPFHAYYDFNNRGTKLTHRARHGIHLDHNNLTGNDDTLSTSFTAAQENAFDGGSFSYNYPLENIPLSLSLSGSYVKTRLIGYLKSAKITGESVSLTPGATYSFVQKPETSVDLYAGLEYVNSISAIDGVRTSADRVRALDVGPRIALQDVGGRTSLSSDIHVGLPGFLGGMEDHDANASVANSGGDFVSYTVNAARVQRLPDSRILVLRAGGQWTRDTLNSIEQYRAGGAFSVRGYPESDSAGDYGWNASAEINSPIAFLPKPWMVPFTKKSWLDSLRVVGFLDSAKTYFREKTRPEAVKDKLLIGTGAGLRLDISEYVSAQVDFGFPIGDDSTDKNNGQTHIAFRMGF